MLPFGTTETVTTADDDVLVPGNGIDVWALTIVDEESSSSRRDQFLMTEYSVGVDVNESLT